MPKMMFDPLMIQAAMPQPGQELVRPEGMEWLDENPAAGGPDPNAPIADPAVAALGGLAGINEDFGGRRADILANAKGGTGQKAKDALMSFFDSANVAYGGKGGKLENVQNQRNLQSERELKGLDTERADAVRDYLQGKSQDFRSGESQKDRDARSKESDKNRSWQEIQTANERAWKERQNKLDRDVKGQTTGMPKASQYQVGNFGARMLDAEKVFSDLAKGGYDRSSSVDKAGRGLARVAGLGSNLFTSEEHLAQEQGERNFVNAVLRRESGAAIAPSEFESATLQYFPRIGDSKKNLEQKRRNRAQAIRSFMAEAGPRVQQEVVSPTQRKWWSSYEQGGGKTRTETRRAYNKKTNQTQIIYDDGTKETIDGQ